MGKKVFFTFIFIAALSFVGLIFSHQIFLFMAVPNTSLWTANEWHWRVLGRSEFWMIETTGNEVTLSVGAEENFEFDVVVNGALLPRQTVNGTTSLSTTVRLEKGINTLAATRSLRLQFMTNQEVNIKGYNGEARDFIRAILFFISALCLWFAYLEKTIIMA